MTNEATIEDVLGFMSRAELLALREAIRIELHRRVQRRRLRIVQNLP